MLVGLDNFPLGQRGERPLRLSIDYPTARRLKELVPGIQTTKGGIAFSWDMVPALQRVFAFDPNSLPSDGGTMDVPGLEEYRKFFASKLRPYQREMVQFLGLRSYAINADPMRSGKTPTTLAAASLVGARKVLVVCPSIAKLVWATEIQKWMGLPSTLLYGRAGDEARTFCVTCVGSGRVDNEHCPDCKGRNGQSYGSIIHKPEDVRPALDAARFIICNYDLLIPQVKLDAAGKREERGDLPGWADLLMQLDVDLVIADEAHVLRGRSKKDRAGESRRDRLLAVSKGVPRFWALSGTPIYGRVADLWALLDVVTDGLYGRPFFDFDIRYAGGHKGEYGWVNDGRTNEEELKDRLEVFMLKRDRATILPHLPPKTRQVVRIDAGKAEFKQPRGKRTAGGLHGALRVTARLKEDAVVEAVSNECGEGAKVVVFSYLRENAESLAKAIAAQGDKDTRLASRNFRVWCVSGDTPVEARFRQAQAFREWTGAGVFVATIDSVPVAISLKGAQSVHFADLTFDPASLLQAEDRPYEVGTSGLTIVYYMVEKTVDEHVVGLVLPKMETLESMVKERAAGDFRAAFGGVSDPDAMAEEVWARMEAAA
jgi:SNF2 family DNA or RNA helicase